MSAPERRGPVPPRPAANRLAALLTGIFVGTCILKLCGFITWSWALILAPIWLPWAAGNVFVVVCLLAAALS